jgi:hypothetical protein
MNDTIKPINTRSYIKPRTILPRIDIDRNIFVHIDCPKNVKTKGSNLFAIFY